MQYEIFCRIVDNFGDAAVCWRLARQLACEHGHQVRLWMDLPHALGVLRPDFDRNTGRQMLEGVEVLHWTPKSTFDAPGDVVIEGFGCGLPDRMVLAMAARARPSLWIVLEYLSAESWVVAHHGLASPPSRPELHRYFFFPGFVKGTGGLLRESGLAERRRSFLADRQAGAALWRDLGFAPPAPDTQTVSLFGYENANVGALLSAMSEGMRDLLVLVPPSRLRQQVSDVLGQPHHPDGMALRRGRLEVRFIPFLPQPRYDELLWSCDWNFVRGEDSFVRAQWAALPFVWDPYHQEDNVHWDKLNAFLALYTVGLDSGAAAALGGLWRSWSGGGGLIGSFWQALQPHALTLQRHAVEWEGRIATLPDLATNLANFSSERLK